MKTVQSKDGTMLAYDIYGDGPPLLFITGATCFRSFEPVLYDANVFAKQFTVYNFDRRGRGDSDNTLPYDIECELEDIEALIDAAGGEANVYGHSSGAILALEAAVKLENKVKRLVMYDPAYADNAADLKEFKELSQELYKMLALGKHDEALCSFLRGIGTPVEIIDGMFRKSPQWSTMLASHLPPVAKISQLKTPTQIIVGEKSPASMHEVAKQLDKAIPNTVFSILEEQDHMPDPEIVLQAFAPFLQKE
ncbi:alpha/beta fold hydrolase [Oceanobacillus sp. CFH 90083]|uniref:alpha/beta fold hydrolase n=1 Tax=Oceanobacillus sp. CFH 90083 TaxID=2592336 RepID=UPI00128DE816|nr:alpha/beta hydrolase [Oceanobacillus sp. CFH 90083]